MVADTANEPALILSGLRQVVSIPGSDDTFTLHVDGDLRIEAGSFVGVLGQTGCGKTTLLTVLGLLRTSTPGSSIDTFRMSFWGEEGSTDLTEIWRQNRSERANRLRRRHLGFALQHGELLPSLTVAENIAFPLRVNGWKGSRIRSRVDDLVNAFRLFRAFNDPSEETLEESEVAVGTSSLADVRVNHLSGGQYQRVALARAIAHQPEFLFVDEPTASLNRSVARIALQQLAELRSDAGKSSTVVMVTHDERFAKEFCDQIIRMRPRSGSEGSGAAGEVVLDADNGDTSC